jgi:hypothetical protein
VLTEPGAVLPAPVGSVNELNADLEDAQRALVPRCWIYIQASAAILLIDRVPGVSQVCRTFACNPYAGTS